MISSTFKGEFMELPKYTSKDDYPHPLPFDPDIGFNVFAEVEKAPVIADIDDEFKKKNCYNGQINIMRSGVILDYTPEQSIEIMKCQRNVFYFLKNYAKIVTLDDGIQLFDPFQYQKNMIKLMVEHRFTIFNLPRLVLAALYREIY